MQVPFVYGPDDLRLREIDVPRAGPRDVVLKVGTVGICGSDLGFIAMGGVGGPGREPFPLGHELSGTVLEAGGEVTTVSVGDRVIINPLVNFIGNGAPEGGFGERLLVRDVTARPGSLLPLPKSISLDTGALVEPLAVSVHAINRMHVKPGDKVAIFGAGPIGLAAIVALRHRGVEDIVVFELSAFRLERAMKLGARAALDPRVTPAAQALIDLHGAISVYGTDIPQTTHYLEASGAPIIPEIVAYARPLATICVASLQKKPVPVNFVLMMGKELTLTATLGYPTELTDVLKMLDAGVIDPEAMVSHRFKGADVMKAFETAQQPDRAAKVLVQYDA
jgi:2-desacetyl-2-hydroxyethyl bacteriochlorophyllide A dehydrogenase